MQEIDPVVESGLKLRSLQPQDGAMLHQLVAACPPLDLNSTYAYMLLCQHHAQTSVVAEKDGVIVGAITAYIPPQQKNTLFVWQVAVDKTQRGQGLGKQMLNYLLTHCMKPHQLAWMETTISPSNTASQKLFTSFAKQHQQACASTPYFLAADFGTGDHEDENLYKIGPWNI